MIIALPYAGRGHDTGSDHLFGCAGFKLPDDCPDAIRREGWAGIGRGDPPGRPIGMANDVVLDDGVVLGNAVVIGDAIVLDDDVVLGNPDVMGDAVVIVDIIVMGDAVVVGDAIVLGAPVVLGDPVGSPLHFRAGLLFQ